MQVAAFASFTGDENRWRCRQRMKEVLIPNQLAADGLFSRESAAPSRTAIRLQRRCDGDRRLILSTPQDDL
jgi:hypothetical protein